MTRPLITAQHWRRKGILGVVVVAVLALWLSADDPDLWARVLGD